LENHAQEYVAKNVENDNLVDTWYRDDSFQEACINFVNSDDFNSEKLLENVGKLPLGKFTEFLNKASEPLTSSVLIGLRRNWLAENPSDDNYKDLIFGVDFNDISDKDKFKFYLEVIKDMDGDLVKRVSEHMFPEAPEDLNADNEIVTLLKYCDPSDEKLTSYVENNDNTRIKNSIAQYVKQQEQEIENRRKMRNSFVAGTCDFTETTASSLNQSGASTRNVHTNTVSIDSGVTTWKIRMDNLDYSYVFWCFSGK